MRSAKCLYFSVFLCRRPSLQTGEKGGRGRIIPPQESLGLYKAFNSIIVTVETYEKHRWFPPLAISWLSVTLANIHGIRKQTEKEKLIMIGSAPWFSSIYSSCIGHLLQLLAEKNSFLYLPDRIQERRILREDHMLNMELDLQSLFGHLVYCTALLIGWYPATPPPALGLIYEGALPIGQPK